MASSPSGKHHIDITADNLNEFDTKIPKHNNQAFTELPEQNCELNQKHPVDGDKESFQDTPGDYRLIKTDSTEDIKKKLNEAPRLVLSSFDDIKEKNNGNNAVPSLGCSNVSTARVVEQSMVSKSHSLGAFEDADSVSQTLDKIPSQNTSILSSDYVMFLNTLNNLDLSERSQLLTACTSQNLKENLIRTTSSNEDNMTVRDREETNPKSFMYDGGASAADGGFNPSSEVVSVMPSDDTLLTHLSLKIINLLQYKLEIDIGATWRELCDRHRWSYSRIRDFENHCKASNKSVFQSLLYEPEFQEYTLGQLKSDLENLPRKDVLCALNNKMQELYH